MSCGNQQESICPQARVELPPLIGTSDSLRLFEGQVPAPDGPTRRAMSALSPLFVRADEAIEIVERVMAGYGTTRISRSALDSRSTRCRRAITGARRYSHR